MGLITIDYSIPATDCLGYCPVQKNFVALTDLKEGGTKGMKRRIVAISEGIHNGIQFRASEIEEMVQASAEQKKSENRAFYKIPLVVDHSDRIIDKVGNTFALEYSTDPANDNPAALADVEFWTGTPMLDEVAFRVRKDPENTFFSVRVRGEWMKDDDGEYLAHLKLIHIAVVNEPADSNARILGELSENNGQSDFSLNNQQEDITNMGDDTTTQELQKEVAELKQEVADLKALETELGDRVQLMSEILATDPAIDKDFIKSMSKDQLTQYKAELERAATAAAEKKSTEKSMSSGGADEKTAEDLAKKYYGVGA